jgi:hypothetical protein
MKWNDLSLVIWKGMLLPEFPKVVELLLMHYLLQKEVIIDFNLFKLLFILIVATSDIPFIYW